MEDSVKIAYLIERLGNLLRTEQRSQGMTEGLQPVHIQMLGYLSLCNRYSNTPAGVTDFVGATKGTTSQSLGLLERKGYIRKKADNKDGRVVHLELTARGKRFLETGFPPSDFVAALGEINAGERGELSRLLTELLVRLQRENGGRMFGVCLTCRHFRRDGLGETHQCGLTLEPLTKDESLQICREHEFAA